MNKFIPKSYKFKKIRKRLRCEKGKNFRTYELQPSYFGLKILENGNISSTVLEAARRSITKKLKKSGILHINGFPSVSITKKPVGVRMGKGCGGIAEWILPVKRGLILFTINGVSFDIAKAACKSAAYKLPLKTKFIYT